MKNGKKQGVTQQKHIATNKCLFHCKNPSAFANTKKKEFCDTNTGKGNWDSVSGLATNTHKHPLPRSGHAKQTQTKQKKMAGRTRKRERCSCGKGNTQTKHTKSRSCITNHERITRIALIKRIAGRTVRVKHSSANNWQPAWNSQCLVGHLQKWKT